MNINFGNLKVSSVEIITIGLKCLQCGKTWGVNLRGKEIQELPIGRFICESCNKVNYENVNQTLT